MAQASAANDFAHEPGLSKEEIARRYSEWAKGAQYEQDLGEKNYRGPLITAETMAELFPDEEVRKNLYILDVAAGTGLVGSQLQRKGFSKIDALEPSEGMLNLAISKNVYTRTFQNFLGEDSTNIEPDYYDVAIICGGMGQGHIPCNGIDELVRLVKPGGHVMIVMRESYLTTVEEYKDRLEPHMKELELDGKWEAVSRTVVPKYSFDNNGVIYIFKIKNNSIVEG
ncbi:methyltransferase-like protein 27 isoform X2 [Physella acuta]|nr:methyltransferase-like protein 27 isoform X2 [Physella acuta]XP_059151417.1 methyltransferase-like protein 27 isoform X2 [Physella acuta]XP_059151418.1 methyltransferase-like protein 27 isoform X2 [Physella acuta]XP_059151419.1 methyltransferase-like protein 27 isoform X2 [Physella acuta]XP_059151420.1 methyltransferase-like protein 27 isoform X2 [Physella acuta]XP_059151421.1 methyltransferase-like protein 27 isoform X2 [Physella acuta]